MNNDWHAGHGPKAVCLGLTPTGRAGVWARVRTGRDGLDMLRTVNIEAMGDISEPRMNPAPVTGESDLSRPLPGILSALITNRLKFFAGWSVGMHPTGLRHGGLRRRGCHRRFPQRNSTGGGSH